MAREQSIEGLKPDKSAAIAQAQANGGKRKTLRRAFGMASLNVVSWAGPRLARVGFIRKPLVRSLEKHIMESSERQALTGKKLPHIVQDRMDMGLTILKTIENAVAGNRLSASAMQRIVKNLAVEALMKQGEESSKKKFRAKFGINPPEILLVSPTKACNLRCKGCYADSAAIHERLPWSSFDRLVTELHDLWGGRFCVFSGGEPLMYKDDGFGVLDLVERHPDIYFMMYTNGTLITDRVAQRMGELGNLMPAISIEGLREKTDARRGAGVFDQILGAMERLRKAKVFYGVSITATRENVDEIMSDEVIDFYFKEMGALFAWVFHYMPMGRAITLDLMPTPEQRLRMWQRTWELIRDRRLFIADFWNGGTSSQGCIGAGRSGGYLSVVWNGDVVPCVFMPYSPLNVNTAYAEGMDLNDIWAHPFLDKVRKWQYDYGYDKDYERRGEVGNFMMPCPIRDHYADFRGLFDEFAPKPLDENAATAAGDPAYRDGMIEYNKAVAALMDPIWEKEYKDLNYKIVRR